MNKIAHHFFCFKHRIALVCVATLLISCNKKVLPALSLPPKSIDIQEIDFEYFHGKARLNFKDNKQEQEVKANIRIRKDSVIWMTFSVIGVQGGKALISKDSITIVSTVSKEYFVFSYGELSKRLNFKIDFNVIQAAMLGNLIIPKHSIDTVLVEEKFNRLLQSQGTVEIKNSINKEIKKLEIVELNETTTGNKLKIDYSDFQLVGDKLFPYKDVIGLLYKTQNGIINNVIMLEYSKAEVGNRELRFPFNIPKRYDRK